MEPVLILSSVWPSIMHWIEHFNVSTPTKRHFDEQEQLNIRTVSNLLTSSLQDKYIATGFIWSTYISNMKGFRQSKISQYHNFKPRCERKPVQQNDSNTPQTHVSMAGASAGLKPGRPSTTEMDYISFRLLTAG